MAASTATLPPPDNQDFPARVFEGPVFHLAQEVQGGQGQFLTGNVDARSDPGPDGQEQRIEIIFQFGQSYIAADFEAHPEFHPADSKAVMIGRIWSLDSL